MHVDDALILFFFLFSFSFLFFSLLLLSPFLPFSLPSSLSPYGEYVRTYVQGHEGEGEGIDSIIRDETK